MVVKGLITIYRMKLIYTNLITLYFKIVLKSHENMIYYYYAASFNYQGEKNLHS